MDSLCGDGQLGSFTELELCVDHGLDTIVHVLDEGDLGAAETAAVGDVEDAIAGVGVLTVATANLHVVLVSDALEARPVLHEVRQVDVDRCSEGCSKVGGARSDVAEMIVVSELSNFLDIGSSTREATEDLADISALLHGDDTELILLVHPDKESLGIIVEDAAAIGPVAVETAGLKEAITLLEEEVVSNELLLVLRAHRSK